MNNYLKITFKSHLSNVSLARAMLVGFLMELDLSVQTLNELKTALSEAVTNAIIHGYNEDETKEVFLEYRIDDNVITIIVKDEGVGIKDIDKALEPTYSTLKDTERAGLGFTIMEVFSDSLEVVSKENVGTIVKMTKNRCQV